jgi:hypothetical protein
MTAKITVITIVTSTSPIRADIIGEQSNNSQTKWRHRLHIPFSECQW